jgi:hypothetical protein
MNTKFKSLIAAAIVLTASQAVPAHAGTNFNLSIGFPVAVAAVPPPPPVPVAPRVVVGAPDFFYAPSLGFYVSVGGPMDIFFCGGNYYRYDRGYWYSSRSYNGHWARTHSRGLPPELRRHSYKEIRDFRDRDYRRHMETRNHGHYPVRDSHRGDRHGHRR